MTKWAFRNLDQSKGKNIGRRKQSNFKNLIYSGLVAWTLLMWAVSCQDAWKSKNNDKFNEKTEINKIIFDLSNYLEKDKYQITITYEVGDNNENSSSWW